VQALNSTTVFPCYAPEQREIAARIAEFLERGADVRIFLDEGEIRPGEDLVTKARAAHAADVALILFSRESLPARWPRAQWEAALVSEPADLEARIGFVTCDDCSPPKILRPYFDMSRNVSRGMRELKRWIRARTATFQVPMRAQGMDLEWLGVTLADRPGFETVESADVAFEFADSFREDFDEVFRVFCGGRSQAALLGDLGSQLGLKLYGEVEENQFRIGEFCAARRFLLILDDARSSPAAATFTFGGRCSTLLALNPGPTVVDELHDVQRAFREPGGDWTELCRMARVGRRLLGERRRIAECHELMEQWRSAAELRGDRAVMNEAAREMIWILQTWGREDEAWRLDYECVTEYGDQMWLFEGA
jgi:hypothetical protein